MKSSLITLGFFLSGCALGAYYMVDFDIHKASLGVLYVLMILIGMNIGCNQNFKEFFSQLSPKMFLVPLTTITGTILFSALGGFILSRWTSFDCMAVGCGFAYYSVSSILITQLKTASLGVQLATELGTIALLSNIFREMFALIFAPFLRKHFGLLAPISAAGIGSSDVSLAVITKYCGMNAVPIAILHGLLINISMPFFVSFFCNL